MPTIGRTSARQPEGGDSDVAAWTERDTPENNPEVQSDPTAQDREHALADIQRTYREYVVSGHSTRWSQSAPGSDRAARDLYDGALAAALDSADARPRRYVGIDLLEERVERARGSAPWAEFVTGSADRIPLRDGEADAVAAITLLSSIGQAWLSKAIAREIDRVMHPGGRLIVYDIRYPSPSNESVHPVTRSTLAELFPGWSITSQSITLLPPLARSPLVGGGLRYSILSALPFARSHLASILVKPA
jgi:SAM-dependent methyltransferase